MPLVIPADFYEVAYSHIQSGNTYPAVCTLGVHWTGAAGAEDFSLLSQHWETDIMPRLCQVITYSGYTVRNEAGTINEGARSVPGGSILDCAPYSVAYLVKKVTAIPGRAFSGRMYLPGVAESHVDPAGFIDVSVYTALGTALGDFWGHLVADDWQPVLLHNVSSVTGSAPPPSDVITFSLDHRTATQRDRLRR